MKLLEIQKEFNLVALTPVGEHVEVTGVYTSDLLSDVMANSKEGDLWLTLQGHQNIIAVALLNDLSGVVVTGGYKPDDNTISKAIEKNIALFTTKHRNYELSGKLYQLFLEE